MSNMIRGFAGNISLFDEFGFSYYGPIDGHDLKTLIKFLNIAKKRRKPIVIHIVTKKGKGYQPAEEDSIGVWHGVGPFDPITGTFLKKNQENQWSWSNIFSKLIETYAANNENFRVIVPAMIYGSALNGFQDKFPEKIIDVGICESFAVCFSAALSLNGMQIFLPIYSSFLQRAYDQVSHDLARQDIKIVIGIDRAGVVGGDGDTHQGIYDIAYLRHIPNIEIVQPSTMLEAKQLLDYAFNTAKHSVAIRYSRGSATYDDQDDFERITEASWIAHMREGSVNLIAYGDNFTRLNDHIETNNLPINTYNARFIKPLDKLMLEQIAKSSLETYVLEDSCIIGGLGSAINEYLQANDLPNKIKIIGLPDEFIEHGSVEEIYQKYGLDTDSVIKKMIGLE
ncbi:MAG TPA: transketolase C-terminal domain-containing protein, partial [Bacillota bacterium]|nr:transketolase C-terminal domain-containing protein [Bacillota bacterium]